MRIALAILICLALGAIPCAGSSTATISLNRYQLVIDQSRGVVRYSTDRLVPVGLSALMSVQTAYVPLLGNEHASDLESVIAHQDTLADVLPPDQLDDITTSDNSSRNANIRRDRARLRPGFVPVQVVRETETSSGRYAELAIYPVTVSPDGKLLFNRDITIGTTTRQIQPGELIQSISDANIAVSGDADQARVARTPGVANYLIVTSSSLAPSFEPLRLYKQQTGYGVEIVTTESILQGSTGRDDAEKLRNYLKGFGARGGQYVLLGGDESVVPIRYAYDFDTQGVPPLDQQQVCDLYFANLTGDWNRDNDSVWGEPSKDAPDLTTQLYVGRLPFRTASEIAAYTDKLIEYETCSGTDDPSYLGRSFIFSSDQMRDYGVGGQHLTVAEAFPSTIETDTANGIESLTGDDPNPSNLLPRDLQPILSTGFGFISVIAHGRPDGFVVRSANYNDWPKSYYFVGAPAGGHGSLDSLFAFGKPAFCYSISCDNGSFDTAAFPGNGTDRFTCRSLLGNRHGAVAFVGYTRWGWVSMSYRMQAAFYDSLFAHPERPAVAAMYSSKAVYKYYRDIIYGQGFFGDPTLRLFTKAPKPVSIKVTAYADSLALQVTCGDGPLGSASLYLSDSLTLLGQYQTDQNGHAVIVYPFALATPYTIAAVNVGEPVKRISYTRTLVTGVDDNHDNTPLSFALSQNYPNPFNPNTRISFSLPKREEVLLTVYNVLGQSVATLSEGFMPAGEHEVQWDATDDRGRAVASGVYLYRLQAGSQTTSRKMVVLR